MVRERLSALAVDEGKRLLSATDDLDMRAHGAMWLLNHQLNDWRYYLVTSLADTLGRRRTYRSVIEIFDCMRFAENFTPEDIFLAGPHDEIFDFVLSEVGSCSGDFEAPHVSFHGALFNGVPLDAVVYRAVRASPDDRDALETEKRFLGRLKACSRMRWGARGRALHGST